MHTAEKEVYNVECVFLFQVHLRIKYDIMSFVCNKLSVLHEGHSRCGEVSKWTDLSFHTEVSPKQAFMACGGGAKNASPRDAAPSYCGIECTTQTDKHRIGSASFAPPLVFFGNIDYNRGVNLKKERVQWKNMSGTGRSTC